MANSGTHVNTRADLRAIYPLVAGWVLIGGITYLLSITVPVEQVTWLDYVLPPLFVGLPFAFFEDKFLRIHLHQLTYRKSVGLRLALFLVMIIVTYGIIGVFTHDLSGNQLAGYLFHFLLLWGASSVALLAARNIVGHFDPGSLVHWSLGRYHAPNSEFRMFLFIDLNRSTSIAEKLGHEKYFRFLSTYFSNTSELISAYEGEIYQHVGDEMIISWDMKSAPDKPVQLFFALERHLKSLHEYFECQWGEVPEIKASLHSGYVTRGEIRSKKREFIYSGDVLNSTSRLQSFCNEQNPLVISGQMLEMVVDLGGVSVNNLGEHRVKGREEPIHVFGLNVPVSAV